MANFIYTKAKNALLKGDLDLENSVKVLLVNTSIYTANQSSDEFVSDIPSNAVVYTSSLLSNKSITAGTFDADDLLLDNYDGTAFQAVILYQLGSNNASSRLISYIDDSEGLPFPGTNDPLLLTLQWDNTNTKIISL